MTSEISTFHSPISFRLELVHTEERRLCCFGISTSNLDKSSKATNHELADTPHTSRLRPMISCTICALNRDDLPIETHLVITWDLEVEEQNAQGVQEYR